jgi:hypothetical protein
MIDPHSDLHPIYRPWRAARHAPRAITRDIIDALGQ